MAKATKKVVKKTAKSLLTKKITDQLDAILLGNTKTTDLGYILFRMEMDTKEDEILHSGLRLRNVNPAQVMTLISALLELLEEKGISSSLVLLSVMSAIKEGK